MEFLDLFYTKLSPFLLFVMMVGLGLSLTVADLKRVFAYPKAATLGVVAQFIFLPLLAFGLVELIEPIAVVAVGIILLASLPSGITSNTYTFAARGDVALSVTLTAISSLVTVLTIPFYTWFSMELYMEASVRPDVPALTMMRSLAIMTVLPVTLGMLIRYFKEAFALRWIETVRKAAFICLIVIIVGSVILSLKSVQEYFMEAALISFLLNAVAMTAAFFAARLFRLSNAQVICLTYEVGVHNLAVALTISLVILHEPVMGLTALIYGIFAKITSLLFMLYARKLTANDEAVSTQGNPAPTDIT